MSARFVLRHSAAGQHHFNLVAANGEVVLTSETYTTAASARVGIESVRRNGPVAERYERRRSKDGQEYFVLKGANGEIIGTSEMYTTAAGRDRGIEAVRKAAAQAAGP